MTCDHRTATMNGTFFGFSSSFLSARANSPSKVGFFAKPVGVLLIA